MLYLAAAAIGLAVGCAEFFLLKRFTRAVLAADAVIAVLLLPVKLLLLAAALVGVFFLSPELLWLTGVCIVLPLLAGAVITALRTRRGGGVGDE